MDRELLAREMRERALLIEADENLNEHSLRKFAEVAQARAKKKKQLEALKRLYFDAGRWAGGARDYTARIAFMELQQREKHATH